MNRKSTPHTLAPKKDAVHKSLSAPKNQNERLAAFLRKAKSEGIKPVDETTLDSMGEVWPEQEPIDEFISWLRKSRKDGRY